MEIRPREKPVPADLGAPELPGSKSHAQRAMLLAAAGSRGVLLRGAPRGRDTEALAGALRALGVRLCWRESGLWVEGGLRRGASGAVHLGENGTALRVLPVVTAMLGGRLTVAGDQGLERRPLDAVFALLAQADVYPSSTTLPLTVDGTHSRWPTRLCVEASVTTQPASGALLGLALRARLGLGGGVVEVRSPAAPGYVELTARILESFGHGVELAAVGADLHVRISAEVEPAPTEYAVPLDPSAAAYPLALAALHGLDWQGDLDRRDPHPELGIGRDLELLRAAPAGQRIEVDTLAARPDGFPALCAVAAARPGETAFRGAPALRAKESDRISAMATALAAAGVRCHELGDGLIVQGPLAEAKHLLRLPAPADHRVIMALALLGTVTPGGVALPHADAVAKSWPGFFEWLARVAEVRGRP